MHSLPKIQAQPFQFLLYVEWVMLASCGSLAIVEAWREQQVPVQHVLILGLLGVMGLGLPIGNSLVKILYTALEIGLIFYGTMLGYLHILPTLYLIVLIRSCFLFPMLGRWAIAGLSFLLFLINQLQHVHRISLFVDPASRHQFWMHQFSEVLIFALGLFFVMQLINTLLTERQTRQKLDLAHEQLRQYALQVEDLATVQERNRIARDIHDSLGHVLTALNVQLQTALKLWFVDLDAAQSFLSQAKRLGEVAIKEVRQSVHALRVDATGEPPLQESIAALVEEFQQGTGIPVTLSIEVDSILSAQTGKTLYRIVQESLTNICKYAQATVVQIQIKTAADFVHLTVADNGQGFQIESSSPGFGLQGMRERVAALNGTFQIETQPSKGCRIWVKIPVTSSNNV